MNISGIIINKQYATVSELESDLKCQLSILTDINTKREGRVFLLKHSTLILTDSEIATDPFNVMDLKTISFALSTTASAYSINICENNILKRSIMTLNNSRLEDSGEKLTQEKNITDDYNLIIGISNEVLRSDLIEIVNRNDYYSVDIENLKSHPFQSPTLVESKKSRISEIHRGDHMSTKIIDINDEDLLDYYFDLLTHKDSEVIINTLNKIDDYNINKQVLSYLLNLSNYHWDLKVRRKSKDLVKKYAPDSLWQVYIEYWDPKYFQVQMFRNSMLLNNKYVDAAEYLVFAQANRRNYFNIKPKKGDVPYMSDRYNDEAENIYECYNVEVSNLSPRILKLQNIGSANFRNAPNLDWANTIEKLSQLNNLHFLQIANCGIESLPPNMYKLQNLKKLIVEEKNLLTLPSNLNLPNLISLDIKGSKINSLNFDNFPRLSELWIDGKHILEQMKLYNLNRMIKVTSGRFYQEIING